MRTTTAPAQLRARSAAFALLGRILGPDTAVLTDRDTVEALRAALAAAGDERAAARLGRIDLDSVPDPRQLAGAWVRWFDLGRVAPYEGSNIPSTAGGITPRLADVAGFYRAFGLAVIDDRPDHVVAQLEFLALTLLAEAEAIEHRDSERAEIAAAATRSFLRDHIGSWIDGWAARIGGVTELAAWFPYAAAAADLVRSEAAGRNVIPLRERAVLQPDAGMADDDEATVVCGDDDLWSPEDPPKQDMI